MSYEYQKNSWEGYKEDVSIEKQPDSIITKKKLDIMELGIERASMTIEPGNIIMSDTEEPSVSVSVDEISHSRKINIAFPKQKSGVEIKDEIISSQSVWSSNKINNVIDKLNDRISELAYKPIEITQFSNNINYAEKGQSFEMITLKWSTNTPPTSLTLNGEEIDPKLTSIRIPATITGDVTYLLQAVDDRGNFNLSSTSVSFMNGIYYGVSKLKPIYNITSEFVIENFSKELSSSKETTFSVNALGDNYIYFIYPASYGEATFFVGGFEGGFGKLGSFQFTNLYNYTEIYNVYVSTNANLGSTLVEVK